jgi:putative transposase
MPRLARKVFAGIPHLILQRGNRGETVFETDEDRNVYLTWLGEYSKQHKIEILAYCLMASDIHLVAVPKTGDSLQWVMKPLHMRYAQRYNRYRGWKGHVWQGRYFSSPLDKRFTWAAIRYVERIPVRAKLVRKAERYPWSSAAGNCGLKADRLLTLRVYWKKQIRAMGDWSSWLAEKDVPDELIKLQRNIEKGLPCGEVSFVHKLERLTGRSLTYRPQGRPRKEALN